MKIMGKLARAIVNSQPQYPDIHLERDEWDMSNSDEWARIIQIAKDNGASVQFKMSGIHMSYGNNRAVFKNPSDLASAKKFVKDLV